MTTMDEVLRAAEEVREEFEQATLDCALVPRGILRSEAFFLRAVVGAHRPAQIVESGRARGQSTYLFGKVFPKAQVVSVEYDRTHPDAKSALERLAPLPNVACLFGDSRKILPEIVLPGDVVMIDGPKELRALELALELMGGNDPAFVFIHDAYPGSDLRAYLDRKYPWVLYSDHPEFVARSCHLDTWREPADIERWSKVEGHPADEIYSATFACIPRRPGFPRGADLRAVRMKKTVLRLKESLDKRLGRPPKPHPCELID